MQITRFIARRTWLPVALAPLAAACEPSGESWQAAALPGAEPVDVREITPPEELRNLHLGTVRHLAVDEATGRVVLLDASNRRVVVWDPSSGDIVEFGREGDGPGEFRRPQHVWTAEGTIYVEDPSRGTIEIFTFDGQWRTSHRIMLENLGGHGAVTRAGHLLVPEDSGEGLISSYLISEQAGEALLTPDGTVTGGDAQLPDHPLLARAGLLRSREERFPRSNDLVFTAAGSTIWIDQRRALIARLDPSGAILDWALLPDNLVQDRVELSQGFAEQGRRSPVTFFRQVPSTPSERAFLALAGPQDTEIGWSLDVGNEGWTLRPVRLTGSRSSASLPVEVGLWLDDSTLLVGHRGGVGTFEVVPGQ